LPVALRKFNHLHHLPFLIKQIYKHPVAEARPNSAGEGNGMGNSSKKHQSCWFAPTKN